MMFTVLGGTGFIGQHLVGYLQSQGYEVVVPEREEILGQRNFVGHVIYAIGMTGGFRTRPFETIDAHVSLLASVLKQYDYESFLYLSSTRIYSGLDASTVAKESTPIPFLSSADALYDLSKMLGESLCLSLDNPKVRVARLSNVFGNGQSEHTFLGSILATIKSKNSVEINEAPDSCKDYVWINDVVSVLTKIALAGKNRIYNVASGECTTHSSLAKKVAEKMNCSVSFRSNTSARIFPKIDIGRVHAEFGFRPISLFEKFPFN